MERIFISAEACALNSGIAEHGCNENMVTCRWGLGKHQAARVCAFADAWSEWAQKHGFARNLREDTYLTIAEEFVRKFLADGAESAESLITASGSLTSSLRGCLSSPEQPSDSFLLVHAVLCLLFVSLVCWRWLSDDAVIALKQHSCRRTN
jgi:hypothetical protein